MLNYVVPLLRSNFIYAVHMKQKPKCVPQSEWVMTEE